MDGWMGKILNIDLTDNSTKCKNISCSHLSSYLGGRGLGVFLLSQRTSPQIDPFSRKNEVIFSVGPLTATAVPTAGRMSMVSKSPLTGTIFDSNSGGFWGPGLKKAGFDALILSGRAEELSRIEINANGVEIIPCTELAGEKTTSTWKFLQSRRPEWNHLMIGPAGENQVKFASVAVGKNRTLGRGGLGAVLGNKNIKAISVNGDIEPRIAREQRLKKIKNKSISWLEDSSLTSQRLEQLGTAMLMNLINEAGVLPTHNFQKTQFSRADEISGEKLARKTQSSHSSCYNCPIACSRSLIVEGEEKSSPEYESLGLLGANLGLSDPDLVTDLNHLCDELGLDTISTGSAISCLMEMSEKGIINSEFYFGRGEGLQELIKKIACREGIGDELAEGSLNFARKHGSSGLAMQVKGLDIPAFDPRGMKGQALGYMTSNRGACHQRANMMTWELLGYPQQLNRFSESNKASIVIQQQNFNAILDSLIVCKFTFFALAEGVYQEMLAAVTGQDFSGEEFFRIGERIWNLEKLFNIKAGFRREHDTLPDRFKQEEGSGPVLGKVVDEDNMLDEYYELRDWNREGFPGLEKLKELDLEQFSRLLPGGENNSG